jgi:large subunit ribosomal protein L30
MQLPNTEEFRWKKFLKDNTMAKVKITQIKSSIGSTKRQVATLEALGIHKMNQTVEHEATPQVMGMANKVRHLVRVEEV